MIEVLKYVTVRINMNEEESGKSPATSEQIRQQLRDQLNKAEFGSVEFQAASDYFALDHQRYSLGAVLDNIVSAGEDQRSKIYWESELRISETQIALLEHEIESNQSQLPGYSKSYQDVKTALEDLGTVAFKEAKEKYPSEKDKRHKYYENLNKDTHTEFRDIIFSSQSQS